MLKMAFIGRPVRHSLLPKVYQLFENQSPIPIAVDSYDLSDKECMAFLNQDTNNSHNAICLTVPYKQLGFTFSTRHTDRARVAKTTNILMRNSCGQYLSDNTDGVGFLADLKQLTDIDIKNRKIVVFGAGGAARAVVSALVSAGVQKLALVNRQMSHAIDISKNFQDSCAISVYTYDILNASYDLLINATSASLFDKTLPIPASAFAKDAICYDLAYKKIGDTVFQQQAKAHGIVQAHSGKGMLIEQAREAILFLIGKHLDSHPVREYFNLCSA